MFLASQTPLHWPLLLTCGLLLLASPVQGSCASVFEDESVQNSLVYKFSEEKADIQHEILTIFGLEDRPKFKANANLKGTSNFLKKVYKALLKEDDSQTIRQNKIVIDGELLTQTSLNAISTADVIISFSNQYTSINRTTFDDMLWFDVSQASLEHTIIGSELRLYRNLSQSTLAIHQSYEVKIYSLVNLFPFKNEISHGNLTLITSKTIGQHNGWIMFNISSLFEEWVAFPDTNNGLLVKTYLRNTSIQVKPQDIGLLVNDYEKQSFILSYFKSDGEHNIRLQRETRKKTKSEHNNFEQDAWNPYINSNDRFNSRRACQLNTFFISFEELGWRDWIIAPDGYAAYYCQGECSFPLKNNMNATNHAILQTLMHLMHPYTIPKPCCAPTKLTSINVLYFDEDLNVTWKKYKNMVAKSCGCI